MAFAQLVQCSTFEQSIVLCIPSLNLHHKSVNAMLLRIRTAKRSLNLNLYAECRIYTRRS